MMWLNPTGLLAALCVALLLECCWGEPRRYHPLVGFGRLANTLAQRFNRGAGLVLRGGLAWLILVGGALGVFIGLRWQVMQYSPLWAYALDAWALWFSLGAKSLLAHVAAIGAPLLAGDLPLARTQLQKIVSRDCQALDASQVAAGAVESCLENGADAIFASLFYFMLLGGAGALVHRLANTLDAMWGYKTQKWLRFGRCAARMDDVLNWVPARLCAVSYALLGQTRLAFMAWRQQAPLWDSPNAGPVMAAGAGALGIRLGGAAPYHGQIELRPELGFGPLASAPDIARSIQLIQTTLACWLGGMVLVLFFAMVIHSG
ncbi:adenosylcobinamide-phosphate synthase CbiB [Deefgea salmonis]|uniref:Cobalamin biosynthesis protein CobD n=1 Tax=Deefgea salmonis TaxID=2875502 RepID=A0ABS8BHN7_9NEIS|nr:adenosylcobinamide-phosphate synthase CbiB [Deefgea salmonis]MCB5195106.1 adenosylcobinamide-phosphate synthase CbiB [Deefgea salmonis]